MEHNHWEEYLTIKEGKVGEIDHGWTDLFTFDLKSMKYKSKIGNP